MREDTPATEEDFHTVENALRKYERNRQSARDTSFLSKLADGIIAPEATLEQYGWPADQLPEFTTYKLPVEAKRLLTIGEMFANVLDGVDRERLLNGDPVEYAKVRAQVGGRPSDPVLREILDQLGLLKIVRRKRKQ